MKMVFWLCVVLVAYTYVGYGVLLWIVSRLRGRPVLRTHNTPNVSIIMAVRNEAVNLPAKLNNLRLLTYPSERLQVIVVSDGSTDRTPEILNENASWVIPVIVGEARGKAYALNQAVKRATGEILVFLDARQFIESNAVIELVKCFADPNVGAVSGELMLECRPEGDSINSVGGYWKMEKVIRKLESASGSVVGVTGAIYAIRRDLYSDVPAGTILDDLFVPMHIARMGKRVVFQSSAIARDRIFHEPGKEFSRKVRTLTGNYQLIRLAPWLLTTSNPLLFRFVSHKLLRLLIPFLLIAILITSALLTGWGYRAILLLQVVFYTLAAIGRMHPNMRRFRLVSIPTTFVMLNTAAALAFYNFVVGRNSVWV